MNKINENYKVHIDLIKIAAIILVIYNHTEARGFEAYIGQENPFLKIIFLSFSIICKIAVPLFFMCSGALLLEKKESFVNIGKRILRYVIIIFSFTIAYYIFIALKDGSTINILWIIKTMIATSSFSYAGSFWFLYAYIGFLVMLPILRMIANSIDRSILMYIIIINLIISGVFPIMVFILKLDGIAINVPFMMESTIVYPLVGYGIEKGLLMEQNKKDYKFFFYMTILSFGFSGFLTIVKQQQGVITQQYLGVFGLATAIFFYGFCKKICSKNKIGLLLARVIREGGRATLGIYLLHGFVFVITNDVFVQYTYFNNYIFSWIQTIIIFGVCFVLTFVLKRIPVIKMII